MLSAREIYFCSKGKPHYNHELMYYYDFPSNNYFVSSSNKRGKSAYEIALENGFVGTEKEWINSLKGENGITPSIGENGHWFIGDIDTGISAQEQPFNHEIISNSEIDEFFNQSGLIDNGDYVDPI